MSRQRDAIDELKRLETELDATIKAFPFWKALSPRCLTAALFLHFDWRAHRRGIGPRERDEASEYNWLSYLAPFLQPSSGVVDRSSALDCAGELRAIDPDLKQLTTAYNYGYFAQKMPEVWRDYFIGSSEEGRHFTLSHASDTFREAETRDIIMQMLVQPFIRRYQADASTYARIYAADGTQDFDRFSDGMLTLLRRWYAISMHERPLVSDEVFEQATGIGKSDFDAVRAAMFAFADFCEGMASAATEKMVALGNGTQASVSHQQALTEWVAPLWPAEAFAEQMAKIAGVTEEAVQRVLAFFTIDIRSGPDLRAARDGFFPPLIRLDAEHITANFDALRASLLERNVLFHLQKTETGAYDAMSHDLSRTLARRAARLFEKEGFIARTEVPWEAAGRIGDLDLAVYSPSENVLVHGEVKAGLPAEGARMVAHLEKEVGRAFSQLASFRGLPQVEIDRILSQAFARKIRNVRIIGLVLVNGCVGARSWLRRSDVVLANLGVLAAALNAQSTKQLGHLRDGADRFIGSAVPPLAGNLVKHRPVEASFFEGLQRRGICGPLGRLVLVAAVASVVCAWVAVRQSSGSHGRILLLVCGSRGS